MNPNPDPVDMELYGFVGSGSGIMFFASESFRSLVFQVSSTRKFCHFFTCLDFWVGSGFGMKVGHDMNWRVGTNTDWQVGTDRADR